MKQRSIAELMQYARVAPIAGLPMSRRERLERWATVLMHEPMRRLQPLRAIEGLPVRRRRGLRQNGSALALAYADPVLRAEGLAGDTYGDIVDFFRLSHGDAHYLLCDCMCRGGMTAASVVHHIAWIKDKRTWGDFCRSALSGLRRLVTD